MPTSRTYTLSKEVLCTQSTFFKAAFEGNFLNEMDDVVSIQSFEMLIQWLYIGRVCFGNLFGTIVENQKMTSIIEFLRIVDMCCVTDMEAAMAVQIRSIIMSAPTLFRRGPIINPQITPQHTRSALFLPSGHPVRDLVVNGAIEEYIRSNGCEVILRPDRGMQPSREQVMKNSRLESFLVDLVK